VFDERGLAWLITGSTLIGSSNFFAVPLPTPATSVTRRPSSKAGAASTRNRLQPLARSSGCRVGIYFLDDHLLGNARFATEPFEGMPGMGRLWQEATTVQTVLRPAMVE
jgi:hypothetical protein